MTNFLDQLRSEAADRKQLLRRFGLRTAIISLVLLALIAPSCERGGGEERLAVLVDLSSSTALAAVGRSLNDLEERPPEVLLAFAESAVAVDSVNDLRTLELLDRQASGARRAQASNNALVRDETNLERGLRSALDLLPTDGSGRVLLLTDGNATRGDLDQAVALAQRRRVRVDAYGLDPAAQPPRIVGVQLPTPLAVNTAQPAQVAIAATEPAEMILEVRVGTQEVQSFAVSHPGVDSTLAANDGRDPNANATDVLVDVPLRFESAGDVPLTFRLVPTADGVATSATAPSRWRSTARVAAKPRVTLVENATRTPMVNALESRGLELRRSTPDRLPTRLAGYRDTDVLLLHDIDANDLGPARMQTINGWVKGGGTLLFASGESSYGEGGYNDSPIADILPVTFEVREEKADVALMISLDKSYSMKGEKMDLAKEATKAALGELEDEHQFGLVAFDWNTFNIVPLQPAVNREEIREQISKIEASAQTNFYPALESCFRQLSAIEDPTGKTVKHVILVSDGKTYPDDYEGLVRRMYDADITVSTVAVGLESDVELLQQIAEWGHGRSYFVQDAARVQKILLDEARSKLEDTLVEEDTQVVELGHHPVLSGIEIDTAPSLLGYVAYRAKGGAEVLLATQDDQPILARRRIGTGEAWVLATDLSDRWSAPWLRWNGFVPLVSQLLQTAVRGAVVEGNSFEIHREGGAVELEARLIDPAAQGGALNGAQVVVEMSGAVASSSLTLEQVAPGTYRASLDLEPDPSGDVRFELRVNGRSTALQSLYYPGTDELDPLPIDHTTLSQVAQRTDGIHWPADQLANALARRPQEVSRTVELWRFFLIAAGLLYLLELILHRLGKLDRPFEG